MVGEAIEIALVPEMLPPTWSDAATSTEALVRHLTGFRTSSV